MQIKDLSLLFLDLDKNSTNRIKFKLFKRTKSILFTDTIDSLLQTYEKNRPDIVAINKDIENILNISILDIINSLQSNQPIFIYSSNKDANHFSKNDKKIFENKEIKKLFHMLNQASINIEKRINTCKLENFFLQLENFDPLTGLCSYNKIYDTLTKDIYRSNRFGKFFTIMIISIDNYLTMKNTFGEKFSNNILLETSKIITQNSRMVDIVGRWKNNEFVIISPETNKKSAITMAENIRKTIEEHNFEKIGRQITATIGVAQCNNNENIKDIIKKTDFAIYRAKKGGKNKICS